MHGRVWGRHHLPAPSRPNTRPRGGRGAGRSRRAPPPLLPARPSRALATAAAAPIGGGARGRGGRPVRQLRRALTTKGSAEAARTRGWGHRGLGEFALRGAAGTEHVAAVPGVMVSRGLSRGQQRSPRFPVCPSRRLSAGELPRPGGFGVFPAVEQAVVLSVRPPPSLGSAAGNVRSCCGLCRSAPRRWTRLWSLLVVGAELRAGGAGISGSALTRDCAGTGR